MSTRRFSGLVKKRGQVFLWHSERVEEHMTDQHEALGLIEKVDNHYQATLKRVLHFDQQSVWKMLTDPALFSSWLAPGDIELTKGGAVRLNFADSGTVIDSTVSEYDAMSLLEYSWSNKNEPLRPVRYQLETIAGGTQLTLTLKIPEAEDVTRFCAGWEAHLLMLHNALDGTPIKFPFERFVATREAYRQMVANG